MYTQLRRAIGRQVVAKKHSVVAAGEGEECCRLQANGKGEEFKWSDVSMEYCCRFGAKVLRRSEGSTDALVPSFFRESLPIGLIKV